VTPAPRRRYSRLPVGLFEALPADVAKAGPSAIVLLLWLYLSPFRRSLPGVVRAGDVIMADALRWSPAAVRRALGVLEAQGVVAVDRDNRVAWIVSAIADDPPRNENVLSAWAADWAELPPCALKDQIRAEVAKTIQSLEKSESLSAKWQELTRNSSPNSQPNSSGDSSGNGWGTPLPKPLPVPDPVPQPPPQPAAVTEGLDAWSRLPMPPFAAAAAADVSDFQSAQGRDTFVALLEQLRVSKWLNAEKWGLTKGVPTVRKLIGKPELLKRILDGEFADPGVVPGCSQCRTGHRLIEACPPECQFCRRRHADDVVCDQKRIRHEMAENERQKAEMVAEEATTAEREGITVEELRRRHSEKFRQTLRASLSPALRASLEAKDKRAS
jgi:hypothetical protein